LSQLKSAYDNYSGEISAAAKTVAANDSFENNCHSAIIRAYEVILNKREYTLDLDETDYSKFLVRELQIICRSFGYIVGREAKHDKGFGPIKKGEANKDRPIDITFNTVHEANLELKYYVEAKVLVVNNTKARNANSLAKAYVTEGMNRFIMGVFDYIPGCMLGYLLNGEGNIAVQLVNNQLRNEKRKKEQLENKKIVSAFAETYISKHKKIPRLTHFMLKLG
jgi:hypothetical protein